MIFQIPAKAKLTDFVVEIDGQPTGAPGQTSGYKYFSYDLSGLKPGHHHIQIQATIIGPEGAKLDCELRTPIGDLKVLQPASIVKGSQPN